MTTAAMAGQQGQQEQEQQQQKLAVTASSKASPLRWVTAGNPTNYNMLLFRTLNREMGLPNTNADGLAPLLRDKLMPVRMWWLKHAPGAMKQFRRALEHKKLGVPGVVNFVDARTKWFDDMLSKAITNHGIKQVVVVAAGFDTRSYRFGARHLDVRFFEIDLPQASSKKQELVQQLLQPESSCPRPAYIPADLSKISLQEALLTASGADDAGRHTFDASQPTLFTVEGLIYYLPQAAVQQLFGSLLQMAAPGSRVAFDFLHQQVLSGSVPLPPAYKVTAQSVANKGEPFLSGIDNSSEALSAFMVSASGNTNKEFKLAEFLGPRQMAEQQLPHLQWDDKVPPILSFYSFAAFEVTAA